MKLLIFGSRGYKLTVQDITDVLIDTDYLRKVSEIVSGGADGPDSVAIDWARNSNCEYKIFYPDWANLGMRAGLVRNDEMVNYCDFGLAFWDGKSRGTKYTIDKMRKAGKELIVIQDDV